MFVYCRSEQKVEARKPSLLLNGSMRASNEIGRLPGFPPPGARQVPILCSTGRVDRMFARSRLARDVLPNGLKHRRSPEESWSTDPAHHLA